MIPKKLQKGDEIRIISPANSMAIVSPEVRAIATERLEDLGFKVTFSEHVEEKDEFDSSTVQSRVEDIHMAFQDDNVRGILTTIGGSNSNQLLKYLDYDLIKSNPKILCGYSDITALENAIYAKTDLVTYYGPHFSTLGMLRGIDYTLEYFQKCLMQDNPFTINRSEEWSDDRWYINQEKRKFIKNKGFWVINEGEAEGIIIGGNLCTLNLLQGTEFMPDLKESILFLEDDNLAGQNTHVEFERNLQSLIHLPEFKGIIGIVIGRFQKESSVTWDIFKKIIKAKKELAHIPVLANLDFGHTTPQITFPIGGKCRLSVNKKEAELKMLQY